MSLTPRLDRIEKSFLIGGDMLFAQRSPSGTPTLTTTPSYLASDRWLVSYSGTITGTPTASRVIASPNSYSKYASQLAVRRNASTVTLRWEQRIEGQLARMINREGTCSVSSQMFVDAISGATARVTLNVPTAEDNYTSVTQIFQETISGTLNNGSWTYVKRDNISLPDVSNGLAVVWEIQLPTGTDGSNLSHKMTQTMLVQGIETNGFSRSAEHLTDYLQQHQRFYCKTYDLEVAPATNTSIGAIVMADTSGAGGNDLAGNWDYPVVMRSTPTIDTYVSDGTPVGPDDEHIGQASWTGASLNETINDDNIRRWHVVASAEL